jgi:hypothetical protein
MFVGHTRSKTDIPEVELLGPSEAYTACLKALRQNENFTQTLTSEIGPAGVTEMAMFLDVFGPANT